MHTVLASTYIAHDQITEGSKTTTYVLALVENDVEVGNIEVNIAKDKIAVKTKSRKKEITSNTPRIENSQNLLFDPSLHHMTSFSWSDPIDASAGPGTYNLDSYFGKEKGSLNKQKNPSFTFGGLYNYKKMYVDPRLVRDKMGSEGPGTK